MESANSELLQVASATLCNLVLECSPYKESLIAENVIEVLVNLAEQSDSNLKINGVWGLMVNLCTFLKGKLHQLRNFIIAF